MAPDRGKGSPADACQIEVRPVACLFRRHGLTFIRATVTDDLFVEALAKELRQRREALKPKECTVLMVTEADSIYARSLKREIEQRMKARPGQEENPSGPCTLLESRTERAVGSYQYLSNVNASHDSRAEANTSRSDDSGKAKPAVSIYDTHDAAAEGRQQYDYIERLASKIERDVMEGRWDTEHIFAVGLFGLDASDKVSLLKVLKPKFPQARFFSIGLDSVFLQPRNLPHARNLILAAAEDLEGGDDWSRLPPFRRSTQVNYARTFAAVLDGDEAPRLPEQAGIFEVGLKGFIRLNLDVEAVRTMTACGPLCKLWKKMQGLSPAQYLGAIALAMTMTIVGLWLAYRFAREVAGFVEWGALSRQRGCGRASQRAGVYLRAGLVLAAGLMTLYFWFKLHGAIVESLHGDGEPLVFFEGASLWMPTILRGLTVTVGVVALIVCLGRERREERQTFRAGGFFRMAVTEQDLRFRRLLKARFKAVPWPPAFWTGVSEFLPLGRLTSVGSPMVAWRQVERKTCALAAYAVVLGVGGSLLMLGLMSVMDDPTMPSRGREMATLTDFSSRAAMVVMLSLAIAVGLKQGLLRRYFSCVLDARAPLPSTTRGNPGAPRAAPAMTTKRKTALREIEDECLRQYLDETDARPRVDLADPRVRQLVWRCALLDIAGRLLPRRTWTSYVPVAMISLLVLARFGLFENQTVPPVFWIFVALVVALSLWNNVQIYRLAHSLKATLLADLERYGAIFKGLGGMPMHSGAPSPEATEAFFKVQMARIEGIRSGPFAALAEQPFVLALGIPAGGTLITEIVSLYTGAR